MEKKDKTKIIIRNIICLLITIFTMVILPIYEFKNVEPLAMFFVFIAIAFIINPIADLIIGIISGFDIKHCFIQPIIFGLSFFYEIWLLTGSISIEVLLYSLAYIAFGFLVAGITHLIQKKIKQRKENNNCYKKED